MRHRFLLLAALFTLAAPALAQDHSAADFDSARTALTDAQTLRDAGKLDAALSKYKAAHAMAGTAITAYELGRCHMDLGHLVEAHELLLSVARIARNPSETSRSVAAREDAAKLADKLEPRIPTITVRLTGAMPTDVTLTIDGSVIPPEAIGAKRRVDPGNHTIVGKSAGGEMQSTQVAVAEFDAKDTTLVFQKAAAAPVSDESDDDKRFGAHFRFVKPREPDVEPNEIWTLRDRSGAALCTLPCERWVRQSSEDYVELSANHGDVHKRIDVPKAFPFPAGTSLVVHPVTERGTPALAATLAAILFLPYLGGVTFGTTVVAICAARSTSGSFCDTLGGVGGGAAMIGTSLGLMIAHIAWSAWTRYPILQIEESSAPTGKPLVVSVAPTGVLIESKNVRAWIGGTGIRGTF